MKRIFVFDVESIGLYGEGFAWGAVMADEKGTIINKYDCACLNDEVLERLNKIDFFVNGEGKEIIKECKKLKQVDTLEELRNEFYGFYMMHKEDCNIYSNDCGINKPEEINRVGLCSKCYDKFLKELKIYNLLKGGNENDNNKENNKIDGKLGM